MNNHFLHSSPGIRKIKLCSFQQEQSPAVETIHAYMNNTELPPCAIAALHATTCNIPTPSIASPGEISHGDQQQPSQSSGCIFVIDDSATVRRIAETVLRHEGYETWSFQDGIEAMKWLIASGSRTPDLLLVDIGLPKMDGYEVIRMFKARKRFADTICLILSRHDGMVDKLKGRLAGAQAHISKPFTTQELLDVVRTALPLRTEHTEINH